MITGAARSSFKIEQSKKLKAEKMVLYNQLRTAVLANDVLGLNSILDKLEDYSVLDQFHEKAHYNKERGTTLLMDAVGFNFFHIARVLLSKGANPNLIDPFGDSALSVALK